jgi:hypothetical protein
MIKCTDVFTMVHQKISRNKSVIAIHELKIEQINMLVEMNDKIKNHHNKTIEVYKKINEIEILQSVEYTIEREKKIDNLHISIHANKFQKEVDVGYKEKIQNIKELIKYHSDIITYLHEQIPKTGIATNYNINTNSGSTAE